jgi:hypothetical protein
MLNLKYLGRWGEEFQKIIFICPHDSSTKEKFKLAVLSSGRNSFRTALGVKRSGREADHSPPSSAEVKE